MYCEQACLVYLSSIGGKPFEILIRIPVAAAPFGLSYLAHLSLCYPS